LPAGFSDTWYHFKGRPTSEELTDIQSHRDECNAIAIDTHDIHQFDVDVMNDSIPKMMEELPYFKSFGKGLPHFFFSFLRRRPNQRKIDTYSRMHPVSTS
jgi:hypothetical protein